MHSFLTWVFLDGVTKNRIDHILVNERIRNSVRETRVYISVINGSDHEVHRNQIKSKK